ncbi:unnamed protein product [Acanthoscelides obtectus]|uniref:Uncharacterized protein n=1 Tax=Acanthoscelides obtectus TaxID=200917 RepID=A0A9P0LG20_ACAOB|nr:unnamed protein product [Acanthoscelides obtectus]CAK1655194.1 hypothetical protein AOBTE_LOCUS19073 [Acanthoscelides obtectus]
MRRALFSLIAITSFATVFGSSGGGKRAFEIEDGNCTSALMKDLIYLHYVDRWPIPLVERSDKVEHHGDEKIYCVMVKSVQHKHNNSSVEIVKGGVNHTFIEISLKSDAGYGYAYYIHIFGSNSKLNTSFVTGLSE